VKEKKNFAGKFLQGLRDKAQMVEGVKKSGNNNFKQLRFKAAIADYSRAIKLWYGSGRGVGCGC